MPPWLMAITTYDELQDAVANWLNRTDLTARIPEFIELAEARFSRELRRRTVVDALTIADGDTSTALPADCAELRYLRHNSAVRSFHVNITTPVGLDQYRDLSAGAPEAAAVVDGSLLWNREADDAYTLEIVYFASLTPLSDTNPSNDELDEAPDLYLFSALAEAAPFLEHDERVPLWEAKAEKALRSLNSSRESAELGAGPVTMALPVVFG